MTNGAPWQAVQEAAQEVVNAAGTGTRASMRLLDLPQAWIVVLLIVPTFAALAWLSYRREAISTPWRFVLTGLRFAAFALLFLVLCRPVIVQRREEVHSAEVLVLLDDSASMQRQDAYTGNPEVARSLADTLGRSPTESTRSELVQTAYARHLGPLLEREGYVARLHAFAEDLRPMGAAGELTARGQSTRLGDALGQALSSQRGRHVTDIVLISDGRSTGGLPALDAARAAGAAGIPIHTVVVGDTRPERNAVIELVETPSSALEGDELAIIVRVLGRGTPDRPRTRVVLEELEGEGDGELGRPVAEAEVGLSEGGERVALQAPAGPADPRTGDRRFRVSVAPLEGETLVDDNSVEFNVHVSTEKVRVLYVDGYPRWEYRFLKELLKRADENIQVHCFLLSATSDFLQESSAGLTPLSEVPTTRRELLDNFDVIVLGDLDPRTVNPDPERAWEFMESVRSFVESGGGLLIQAGEFDNPRSFAGTPLEELLPVALDPAGLLGFEGDTRNEFKPVLEEPGAPHEVVRLHPDPLVNRQLWEGAEGLRGFHWYSPVPRAKPGSQVLLRHPTDYNENGRYPLLVVGYYPAGRTMWLGVDETWRWRWHYGPRYRERFWRNAIRWLALGRLKSGDRRFRLETTRASYNLDERIQLEARVLDEDFRPSEKPAQDARYSGPDGHPIDLKLVATPGRQGLFSASFEVDRPGLYRGWIDSDGQRVSSTEFEVKLSSRESADPSPDPELMAALASLTRGRAVDLAHIDDLQAEFPGDEERREPISSKLEDAWDNWTTMVLALLFLCAEWILRKRAELV